MVGASLIVGTTPKGKYKAYLWGQADGHVSDRRGCNFRYAAIDGQPFRGYDTKAEAIAFAKQKFLTEEQVLEAGRRKAGRHLSDNADFQFDLVYTQDTMDRMAQIREKTYGSESNQD